MKFWILIALVFTSCGSDDSKTTPQPQAIETETPKPVVEVSLDDSDEIAELKAQILKLNSEKGQLESEVNKLKATLGTIENGLLAWEKEKRKEEAEDLNTLEFLQTLAKKNQAPFNTFDQFPKVAQDLLVNKGHCSQMDLGLDIACHVELRCEYLECPVMVSFYFDQFWQIKP